MIDPETGIDHAALVKFLAALVGDDAEDVAQEVYLKILTSAPHEGRRGATRQTWACSIAKNEAATWLRRRGRRVLAEAAADLRPMADVPLEWGAMRDALDPEDQALVAAKLTHGTITAAARACGLTRNAFRYRFARLRRRMG